MSRYVDGNADLRGWLGPAWAALRARHPDIPDCQFVPAGPGEPDRGFGAVCPRRIGGPDGRKVTELAVVVFPGWLYCSSLKAFEILMHEAVHALDFTRTREVSGHGEAFAALAQEMGLEPVPARREGTADYDVRLTAALRALYADAISHLADRQPDAQRWVIE